MSELNHASSPPEPDILDNQNKPAGRHVEATSEETPISMVGMFRNARAAFDTAYTSAETAEGLAIIAPKVVGVAYGLIALGLVLSLLLPAGFIWGLFSMLGAMMSGFFWLCSSTAMKLHDVTRETRSALRRAMLLEASAFIFAMLALVYFFGKGFELM
jgi:hypothetical protein